MSEKNKNTIVRKKRFRDLSIAILVILILYSSLYTIDETQYGIVLRFGRPIVNVKHPGLHIKLPWPIDRAIKIDRRLFVLDIPSQSLLTYDQKEVSVTPFLVWKIKDPILFAATMRDIQTAWTRLTDISVAELANRMGQIPFNEIVNIEAGEHHIHRLLADVTQRINALAGAFGITVEDIAIKVFLVPAQNRVAVIQRMISERGRIAAMYRSQGVEEALKIEAEAAALHEKILGKAHAEATAIRGKGEAEALDILRLAYEKDPEFYNFIRSLEAYEAIIGKQSTIFLEADSPLLKYFNGDEAKMILENKKR